MGLLKTMLSFLFYFSPKKAETQSNSICIILYFWKCMLQCWICFSLFFSVLHLNKIKFNWCFTCLHVQQHLLIAFSLELKRLLNGWANTLVYIKLIMSCFSSAKMKQIVSVCSPLLYGQMSTRNNRQSITLIGRKWRKPR